MSPIGWSVLALLLVACSDGGDPSPDADPTLPALPSSAISVRSSTGQPQAPRLDCSTAPDAIADAPVLVNGWVAPVGGEPIAGVALAVFADAFEMALAEATTDVEGRFTLTLPVGTPNRTTWRIVDPGAGRSLDTYEMMEINVTLAEVDVTIDFSLVAFLSANALPAFIGVMRTEGLGLVAGQLSDCDERPIENAVVTVGSVSALDESYGGLELLRGSWVYYFIGSNPVRPSQQATTSTNGRFVAIELPPTSELFVQTWGYLTDSDVERGTPGLTLLSETAVPSLADSVVAVRATARLNP